jgi:hypothetical protein
MIAVTATARCAVCTWTAGPGEWAEVDRAAARHVKDAGHPTATSATPGSPQTPAGSRPAAAPSIEE